MRKNVSPLYLTQDLPDATESYDIQAMEDKWRKSRRIQVEVYFDTYDVVRLIQGVQGLLSDSSSARINMELFKNNDMLVHSLAFEGKLGPIRMLAPHQDELVYKLRDAKHLFPARRDVLYLENDLLHNIGLLDLGEASLENLSVEQLEKTVRSLRSDQALDLYKTKDLLVVPHWPERYKRLYFEKKLLRLEDSNYHMTTIAATENFRIFKEALDQYRPQPSMERSNHLDAIAFCLLVEKLRLFQADTRNNPLPIFFVNRPGTLKALRKIKRDRPNLLTYQIDGHQRFPIFREAEFFILDAVFNESDRKNPLDELFAELKTLIHTDIQNYRILKNTVGKDNFDELRENINRRVKEQFFEKIWFRHDGYHEITQALQQHVQFHQVFDRDQQISTQQREELLGKLRLGADKVKIMNTVWKELDAIDDVVQSKFRRTAGVDVGSDLGLVRFSFTKTCMEDIQRLTTELLEKRSGSDEFRFHVAEVVGKIVDNLYESSHQKHHDLAVGLAVLYVFDKWKLVADIAERLDGKYENYHIPMLYAASVHFSTDQKSQRAVHIAACIRSKFVDSKVPGFSPSYKVWIGLAYIYWQIWDNLNNRPSLPEQMETPQQKSFRKASSFEYIQMAIELSDRAIQYLKIHKDKKESEAAARNQRYFYAINLYVYLVTITGRSEEFNSSTVRERVTSLLDVLGHPIFWQHRFYDTIARYYLRRALLLRAEGDMAGFRSGLGQAKKMLEDCTNHAKIHETFYDRLQMSIVEEEMNAGSHS